MSAACLDEFPMDLHALQKLQSQFCYYNRVNLKQYEASDIARSQRGLIAVAVMPLTSSDSDRISLDYWLKGGKA